MRQFAGLARREDSEKAWAGGESGGLLTSMHDGKFSVMPLTLEYPQSQDGPGIGGPQQAAGGGGGGGLMTTGTTVGESARSASRFFFLSVCRFCFRF